MSWGDPLASVRSSRTTWDQSREKFSRLNTPPAPVCAKGGDDSNTPCPLPRDAVKLLDGRVNGAQDGAAGSAGSQAAERGPRAQAGARGLVRGVRGAARKRPSPPTFWSVPCGEHRCGPRGSLTWPGALERSRYCSSLRKPGPPRRRGAWPGQGKGSELAEEAPAYIAIPGSRTVASATAPNIATVPDRCCALGPPWSPAEEL